MESIKLVPMTRELCHVFYRAFQNDPAIYADMKAFAPFVYAESWADAYYDRQQAKKRILLAVMREDAPIGEIKFWNIDPRERTCFLGIHLQNDNVKGKGYGTRAEQLALDYAFNQLEMTAVYADVIKKNKRSQHVLKKAGFSFLREDETFFYYRCLRAKK